MARSISPAPGTIKPPVQRGSIVITTGAATQSATITSVNTDKAELRMVGWGFASASAPAGNDYPTIALTNSTTITATRLASGAAQVTVSWELTEFN